MLPPILQILGAIIFAAIIIIVIRARHKGKAAHDQAYADENVCDHLRPALDLLRSRGHEVYRVGQHAPEMPLEIHLTPAFDPAAIQAELNLADPVFLSERNVLFCKEDWCELHPAK